MKSIIDIIPPMLSGDKLKTNLTVLPEYHENIRSQNAATRLMTLSDLYKIYLPSNMSTEIYSKLYLALIHSLQKKLAKASTIQQNENFKSIKTHEYNGIIGGSDSFTIIGNSGIGKSSAIDRSIKLISENRVIEIQKPYTKIIPCVVVQCPFDCSVKGLLLEILRKVDETIGSNFYSNALRIRATTDMLIGNVSQVALNHIGILIVDEIQNVVNSKHGKILVKMLTQLINNSGISICMVGTPICKDFFEQEMYLARRSLGLEYTALKYDEYFYDFCKTVFSYQYTQNKTEISDGTIYWLYEHSGGIISIVISLIHDAQEIAILNGKEALNIDILNAAYKNRVSLLHKYIEPTMNHGNQTDPHKKDAVINTKAQDIKTDFSIADLVAISKSDDRDIIDIIQEYIAVEVMPI